MFLPGWGMHLADIAEAQGDLIREVGGDQRSIQNSCSTVTLERLGELQRQQRRRHEHAVFDRVDGLAADPDPRRELGLGPARRPALAQAVGEPLSQSRWALRSRTAKLISAAPTPNVPMMWIASLSVTGSKIDST